MRRWLGWFALCVIVGMQAGTIFKPLGTIGQTRVADWVDLLTPFAVLGCAAMVLVRAAAARGPWVLFGVGGVAFTLGHGLHLSANSVSNVADEAVAGAPIVHLWDEVVSQNVIAAGPDRAKWTPGHYTQWLQYGLLQLGRTAEADSLLRLTLSNAGSPLKGGRAGYALGMRAAQIINGESWRETYLYAPLETSGTSVGAEAADAFAVVPDDADLTQCELFNLNVRNNVPSSGVGVATWTPLEYIFTDADGDIAAARFELIGNFINLVDLPFALSEFVVDQGDVAAGGAPDPGTVRIPGVLRQGFNDVNADLDFDRIVRIDLYAPIAETDFDSDEGPDLATAQDFSIGNIGIRCEVDVEACAPDVFLFRQDDVARGDTDFDVIVDWDECDVIGLCGQADPYFTVAKVEIGIYDHYANLTRDVRIGLSNGQFITILDAGDSGDWAADHDDPENNPVNRDNFVRLSPEECAIDGDVVCA